MKEKGKCVVWALGDRATGDCFSSDLSLVK